MSFSASSETASTSSTLSTPESANVTTPLPDDIPSGDSTPKPVKLTTIKVERGAMLPPPVPATAIYAPTPPRMTRLPSLKELSDRLHPSPFTTPLLQSTEPKSVTPPKLPSSKPTSPFAIAQSPSSRLKLPASAMKRSLSANSTSAPVPTLATLGEASREREGDLFTNADPFAGEAPVRPTSMSRGSSREGYVHGYKDVPSLAVIREKVGVTPIIDIEKDVTEVSPKAHALRMKMAHPLRHAWTLYFDSKSYKPEKQTAPKEGEAFLGDYELSLVTVGRIDTIEGFARHLNNIRLPSKLARNSNYHLFKNGIRPMWEDPANAKGGKWVVLFRSVPQLFDASWANMAMALVGEVLDPDDEVCGLVASTRPKIDRIQVWTRGRDDVDRINGLGRRILEAVNLEGRDVESMSMEFQFNASDSNPPANRYIHIPFPAPRASFSLAPPTPSRLSAGTPGLSISPTPSPRMDRLYVNGQIPLPLSPTTPTPMGNSELMPAPAIRRMGSGQGANAFAGPMGMGGGRESFGGQGGMRREGVQV